jgi:5-methylcytosine-specific restriction enzyme subunit McrC
MLKTVLQEACSLDNFSWTRVQDTLVYHRLNDHYEDAHALAWLILSGLGVSDILSPEGHPIEAFLINMNELFEKFVYKLLRDLLVSTGYTSIYQSSMEMVLVDASNGKAYRRIRPDMLVYPTQGLATPVAVDAKYKRYSARKISEGDSYQLFTYALASSHDARLTPHAVIVYPAESPQEIHDETILLTSLGGKRHAALHALGIHIPSVLEEMGKRRIGSYCSDLRDRLIQILKQATDPFVELQV